MDGPLGEIQPDRSAYFFRLYRKLGDWYALKKIFHVGEDLVGSRIALLAYASSGKRVKNFMAESIDPDIFLQASSVGEDYEQPKELSMYQLALSRLRCVTLLFEYDDEDASRGSSSWNARKSLGHIFKSARILEQLNIAGTDGSIDAGNLPQTSHSWLTSIVHDTSGILRSDVLFPCLKQLHLSRIVCQEPELLSMVLNHKSTLERLHLDTVTLVPSLETRQVPCLVRLLTILRACQIRCVKLSGRMTNCSSQTWQVQTARFAGIVKSDLKWRMESWLSGNGPEASPIAASAIVPIGEQTKLIPLEAKDLKGDHTWRMQLQLDQSGPEPMPWDRAWGQDQLNDFEIQIDDELEPGRHLWENSVLWRRLAFRTR